VIDPHPESGDQARRLLTSWCFNTRATATIEKHLSIPDGTFQDWLFDRKRDSYDLVRTAKLLLSSDAVIAALHAELMK
jgi:mevalonate pyrophosphate decarboxylase